MISERSQTYIHVYMLMEFPVKDRIIFQRLMTALIWSLFRV